MKKSYLAVKVKQKHSLAEAVICHRTAGRLRLKIPSKKGNAAYFNALKDSLYGANGLEGIEVNPVTGSVLFKCKPTNEMQRDSILKKAFIIKDMPERQKNLHGSVIDAFGIINGKLKSVTGGDIDAAGAAFLLLSGVGIYQISRGNFAAPAWYTAFWYALNIFLKSEPQK